MNELRNFLREEDAMGSVEIVLIIIDNYLSLIPM